jgi:hypothetical protein
MFLSKHRIYVGHWELQQKKKSLFAKVAKKKSFINEYSYGSVYKRKWLQKSYIH